MERRVERSNKSIFECLQRARSLENNILSQKNIISSIESTNIDFSKVQEYVKYLRNAVLKPNKDIKRIISALEFYLETGNNSNNINISFYCSKIFIDCIELLEISRPEYFEKIFELLEKILNIKQIPKYLCQNINLLPKIFKFLKNPSVKIVESAIKISEVLLMDGLVPMDNMLNVITDIYDYMSKNNKLDAFCRVLGILIFDCRKIEFKQIFKNKTISHIEPFTKIITKNQTICLHFNNFFENLVKKLLIKFNYTKKISEDSTFSNHLIHLFLSNDNLSLNEPNDIDIISQTNNYITIGQYIDTAYTKLTYSELTKLLHLNMYKGLKLDINKLPKNTKNIYNSYVEISKQLALIENKSQIKPNRKQYITIIKYGTYQIEMLFVLSTLLGCKRKIEIQDKLSSLNLIEILSSYLEYIEWGNIYSDNQRPYFNAENIDTNDDTAYHGNGCCCDCDSALKIQYLRAIYSFCCRDQDNFDNKLKLFSEKDIQRFLDSGYMELIKITLRDKYLYYKNNKRAKFNKEFLSLLKKLKIDTNTLNNTSPKINSYKNIESLLYNMCSSNNITNLVKNYNKNDEEMGLLGKLIFKYMQECYYSSARFWLSSCIEVVLRGNNSFLQTFTIYNGLMYCLIHDILYGKQEKNQTLQISFDILGELIKFNRCSFFILDYCFCDKTEFIEFTRKVFSKETLIDSNVFIRSIIISIYFFDFNDNENHLSEKDYFTNNNKICVFTKEKIYDLFLALIISIQIDNINQTNISCINSALLILIIQYLNKNLANFLKNFKMQLKEEAIKGLDNFLMLLKMWGKFYSYRPKDSASLQYSSTIEFNEWQKVANLLLKNDPDEPCSLYYVEKNDSK